VPQSRLREQFRELWCALEGDCARRSSASAIQIHKVCSEGHVVAGADDTRVGIRATQRGYGTLQSERHRCAGARLKLASPGNTAVRLLVPPGSVVSAARPRLHLRVPRPQRRRALLNVMVPVAGPLGLAADALLPYGCASIR